MKIKETIQNYLRILAITKRADKEEFIETIRICGIGIAIIGSIGFLFYLISALIGGL
ncbi:MAG: protein translocase SEC61 complex subunit gamma [Candidatus Aenigmatarchaeota archaeon]|nr:protein translocase SEC61 complex subunit gamma [Candidatus Aenigmarchaeota archaeon]